ncbi:MAG: hypothetical protein IJY30_01400 [Muribaculaceae bacterium]|nr:hypothetical protein [Muribaculaceae bacterium]
MKIHHFSKAATLLAVVFSLSACIDDDYDLSDIDTTAEFQVKDLVLPVNIDEIYLDNIIDVTEGSQIKILNDEYVFVQDGEYESGEISIPQVYFDAPAVAPVNTTVALTGNVDINPMDIAPAAMELHYPIGEQISPFSYKATSVSDFIVDMKRIGTDFTVKIEFSIDGLDNIVDSYILRNFKLQIAKGLTLASNEGVYDAETGILSLSDGTHYGNSLAFEMKISAVDISDAGIDYDHEKHSIVFDGNVGIYSGEVVVTDANLKEGVSLINLPESIGLHSKFDFSRMLITSFTGRIKYSFDGLDIAPVNLTNIPDVLSQNMTDIVLANPQIYLELNNPVAKYNLSAQAGLSITPYRDGVASEAHSLDNGYLTIAGSAANDINTFCLSPAVPDVYYAGYENAEHVPYSSLATVLAGDGLPQSLAITLDDPVVPEQDVVAFELGQSLGTIKGKYSFFSALELATGSKIVYSSTEDGWNDEDIDAITIKVLELNALITNQLPLDITIKGYPVDVNGNKINNVEIEGVDVKAGAVDAPLNIKITGEITHLDGIVFEAVATQSVADKALKPQEVIHLKNIRAKVSGNYIKEL